MEKTIPPKRVRSARSLIGPASILAGLLIWWVVVRTANQPAFILPSPGAVWQRFLQSLADGTLPLQTGVTLLEVLLGLFFGVGLATILGYLVAKSHALERVLAPYLVASQAVPIVAIAPLLVIWFGPGMFSKVLICALIVFFPVLVNTLIGIRAVPEGKQLRVGYRLEQKAAHYLLALLRTGWSPLSRYALENVAQPGQRL